METSVVSIADSANRNQAAPALAAAEPATRDLRAELSAAIQVRIAAEARDADADAVAGRADVHLAAARAEVARLQAAQQEAERVTTEARARAISEALRAGLEPPAAFLPAMVDSAPLASAMAAYRAIEAAGADLGAEAADARGEAADAAAVCRDIIDRIIVADAEALAREAIAAIELHWRIIDRLRGLVLIDEGRRGGPQLRGFQDRLLEAIDRRKAAISKDRRYIEQHLWSQYLNDLSDAQKAAWLDYARRLMDDPAAAFDAGGDCGSA
jgi:hypothetical protein